MGDPTKILVRSVLYGTVKNNSVNVPVYPGHMSGIQNPVFPCITLNKRGETRPDLIADDDKLYLSVWSKVGDEELWDIYNQVKKLLNLKSIPGTIGSDYHSILWMREIYLNDNLYEQKTFTHQLATRYHVDMM